MASSTELKAAIDAWVEQYIRQTVAFSAGGALTAARLNELFNLLITQGDNAAEAIAHIRDFLTAYMVDVDTQIANDIEIAVTNWTAVKIIEINAATNAANTATTNTVAATNAAIAARNDTIIATSAANTAKDATNAAIANAVTATANANAVVNSANATGQYGLQLRDGFLILTCRDNVTPPDMQINELGELILTL